MKEVKRFREHFRFREDIWLQSSKFFFYEYLGENEKVSETVFYSSYGAQVELFLFTQKGRKARDAVPLSKF